MRKFLAVLWMLGTASFCGATWFGENVGKGADIMMMDLRYPWWAESTYNAHWNFSLLAPDNFSGYGGFSYGVESLPPDHRPNLSPEIQAAVRPASVWSFWGADKQGEPVRIVTSSRFNYPRQYVGEGASGSLGGPSWPILRNRWYTMVLRVWRPAGKPHARYSYIGRWVKDVEARHWYLYGVARVPSPVAGFSGNGGFLEDYWFNGRSVRALHRRLGYYRKNGVWHKSDTVTFKVPKQDVYWVVNKLENNTVLAMELSSNRSLLPFQLKGKILEPGKTHSFTIDEPPLPTLDKPVIGSVSAESNGRQVHVSWTIPEFSSPMLAYKVEVFADPSCSNQPLAVSERRRPSERDVLLSVHAEHPAIRLSLTDVFDQPFKPVVVRAQTVGNPASAPAVHAAPGLNYEFIIREKERHVNVLFPVCEAARRSREEKHYWVSLSELAKGKTIRRGVTHGFNTSLRGRRHSGYAFKFKGLLKVPADGLYLFHMRGTDGYRIWIDHQNVLTFDGLHGPEPRAFSMNLSKGMHPLAVDYFVDKQEPFFNLEWEGPGFKRQSIPAEALLHQVKAPIPVAVIKAVEIGRNGMARVSIHLDAKGQKIQDVQLFLDDMEIARLKPEALHYSGLLPAGSHRLWTRTRYNRNWTSDSLSVPFQAPSLPLSGWKLGIAAESRLPRNIAQTGTDRFRFIGEGEYVLYREVQGDFTLTCRIDRCLGRHGEPVNGSSWVGLTVRERPSENNHRWGQEFSLYQTARHGLRTSPDFDDLGGSRMSQQQFPANHPWLRIVRHGNGFSAWTSADGANWRFGTSAFLPMKKTVGAGIVFRALPQDAMVYFQAEVSAVSLVPGIPAAGAEPAATPAKNTEDCTLTGIAVAPSNPNVVVLRSSVRGLIRSEDGGRSWRSANGALKGTANVVRSVAIHPLHPEIMLRAAGVGNGVAGSGLYRTRDGGAHWTKLNFPGDFDGRGPSALCGEVIAYHPAAPNIILVGTESSGLFRSTDGGISWKRILPGNQRFTAVGWNIHSARPDGSGWAHAVTCPDAMMTVLGRGPCRRKTERRLATDYKSTDGGKYFWKACERTDLGYFNFTFFQPQYHDVVLYGTTHGLVFTYRGGRKTYLYASHRAVERLRPMTALATGRVKNQTWPRTYLQSLDPTVTRRASCAYYKAQFPFQWVPFSPDPHSGVIAISPCDRTDRAPGNFWWFLCTDALYRLDDATHTFKKVFE